MNIDDALLFRFESGLDPRHVDRSSIPAVIVGYGEISAIFQIQNDDTCVYKRLPLFQEQSTAAGYERMYHEYSDLLVRAGLNLPKHHTRIIAVPERPVSLYIIQEKFSGACLCNHLIRHSDAAFSLSLIEKILSRISRVWTFNRDAAPETELAIDGQLSNWVYTKQADAESLYYIDTSTPLYRKAGVEQQDPELMLQSAPSFLRWIIRLFFLQDVMTRYYDPKLVYIDLLANLYKEQRPDLIDDVLPLANQYLPEGIPSVTRKEVDRYYQEDKIIWRLFLAFRKIDRFLTTTVLGKRYEFILPGKIKR